MIALKLLAVLGLCTLAHWCIDQVSTLMERSNCRKRRALLCQRAGIRNRTAGRKP